MIKCTSSPLEWKDGSRRGSHDGCTGIDADLVHLEGMGAGGRQGEISLTRGTSMGFVGGSIPEGAKQFRVRVTVLDRGVMPIPKTEIPKQYIMNNALLKHRGNNNVPTPW
jgi:hypothetical protein